MNIVTKKWKVLSFHILLLSSLSTLQAQISHAGAKAKPPGPINGMTNAMFPIVFGYLDFNDQVNSKKVSKKFKNFFKDQRTVKGLRHADRVNFAEFSSDGNRAVTASNDRTAKIWDVKTAACCIP